MKTFRISSKEYILIHNISSFSFGFDEYCNRELYIRMNNQDEHTITSESSIIEFKELMGIE